MGTSHGDQADLAQCEPATKDILEWRSELGLEPPMTRAFLPEWLEYNKSKWRLQRVAREGKLAVFNPRFVPRTGDGRGGACQQQHRVPLIDWRKQLGPEPKLAGSTFPQWLRCVVSSDFFNCT
jgi:hypothetical protein